MPELPEVETIVRDLRRARLADKTITGARVYWPKMVAPLTPRCFTRRLIGRRILRIQRRAKYIVIRLTGGETLLIHLRMTGQFTISADPETRARHEHILITLADGRTLRYRDTRKFGRWQLTNRPESLLGRLGPEPLAAAFKFRAFQEKMRLCRRQLKPLLLDQSILAGLGNIYVDEALWEARLHPRRQSHTLRAVETRRLFRAVRAVLRRGIRNRGTSLGDGRPNFSSLGTARGRNQRWLKVFQRTGRPCPRCGRAIVRLIVGQRSTHICPACQPAVVRIRTGGRKALRYKASARSR